MVDYKQIAAFRDDVDPPALNGKVLIAIEGITEFTWCRVDEQEKHFGQSNGNFPSSSDAPDSAPKFWNSEMEEKWAPANDTLTAAGDG